MEKQRLELNLDLILLGFIINNYSSVFNNFGKVV